MNQSYTLLTLSARMPSRFTPADTLSCRRQTNPEDTPNVALSLTVRTLGPLTDMAISGDGPA